MQPYELCLLLAGSNSPDQIQEHTKQVASLLAESQAEVKHMFALGRKKLAYAIGGETHGEYVVWLFEAEPAAVKTLSEKLRLASFALRHVITKLEAVTIPERVKNLQDVKSGKSIVREEREEAEEPREREEKRAHIVGAPRTVIESSEHRKEEKKVSLEELDEKLDEILESDTL